MTELADALDDLLAAHDEIGSPLSKCAAPGPTQVEVAARLAELGLNPPASVRDWFSWHQFDPVAWRAAGGQGAPELFWLGYALNLDDAIQGWRRYEGDGVRYVDPRDANPEEELWRSTWFPVLWGSPSDFVVDCEPATGPNQVRRLENAPPVPDGWMAPILFASLIDLVVAATDSIRRHSYWDESGTVQIRSDWDGLIEHR